MQTMGARTAWSGTAGHATVAAPEASRPDRSAAASRAAALVRTVSALVLTLAAALSLLEVVVGVDPLRALDDASWMVGVPTGPSVVVGLALLVLGAALRAGKRAGWWVLIALLGASAVSAFAVGESGPENVVVPVFWIAALVTARSAFGAQLAPGAWLRALQTATIGLGAAVAAGWALAGTAGSPTLPWPRLVWVVDQLTGGTFELTGRVAATGWLSVVLDVLGGCVLAAALALFFRSVRVRGAATAEDELRLRALIAAHGSADSLAWFATRRDKRVVFGAAGRAAVAYRVVGGSSVAAGDPVGPVDAWSSAVAAWLAEAGRYGWQPVVLAAGERAAAVYREHGLRVRRIGDEAVVDLARLLRTGGRSGRVRRAVRRLSAEGYRTTVRRVRDVPAPELAALAVRADRWRNGSVEHGFSMASGRTADPADLDNLIVEAFAPDGSPCGLLTFAPWGVDGASLDVMRRATDAPAGIVEFMIGHLAAGWGIRRVSLNFVLFREALESGSRLGAGPVERGWHAVLRVASSFVQIESLHRFSGTFEPDWAPRLLCWSGSTARAAVAAGLAEGFLPVPGYGGGDRTTAARPRDRAFLVQVARVATEQTLLRLGFTEAALPPWHPAQPGGHGLGSDGTPERLFHIDRSTGATLHVRQSLADARAMRELLDRLVADLPAARSDASPAAVESGLPAALVPFARPRDDAPETADAWRIVAAGREVALAATGTTDPARLRGMLGSESIVGVFERGVLPFATLRVDLGALVDAAVPPAGAPASRLTAGAAG